MKFDLSDEFITQLLPAYVKKCFTNFWNTTPTLTGSQKLLKLKILCLMEDPGHYILDNNAFSQDKNSFLNIFVKPTDNAFKYYFLHPDLNNQIIYFARAELMKLVSKKMLALQCLDKDWMQDAVKKLETDLKTISENLPIITTGSYLMSVGSGTLATLCGIFAASDLYQLAVSNYKTSWSEINSHFYFGTTFLTCTVKLAQQAIEFWPHTQKATLHAKPVRFFGKESAQTVNETKVVTSNTLQNRK